MTAHRHLGGAGLATMGMKGIEGVILRGDQHPALLAGRRPVQRVASRNVSPRLREEAVTNIQVTIGGEGSDRRRSL